MLLAKVTNSVFLGPTGFSETQMVRMVEDLMASERQRLNAGLDVNDQTAPPLGRRYAKGKSARGLHPYRDMQYTGQTMAARVVEPTPSGARVTFDNADAEHNAAQAQGFAQMLGMSLQDAERIVEADAVPAWNRNIATAKGK